MTEVVFTITLNDLALLEAWQVKHLWEELGAVVLAWAKHVRRYATNEPDAAISTKVGDVVVDEWHAETHIESAVEDPDNRFFKDEDKVGLKNRPKAVPIEPVTVPCEPGCGARFAQTAIAAHRRECPAVAAFHEEHRVVEIPSLATAAPLPRVPDSGFEERRRLAAKEAAERTWQRNHEGLASPAPAPRSRLTEPASRCHAYKRTPEQRERMRQAQLDSRARRGLSAGGGFMRISPVSTLSTPVLLHGCQAGVVRLARRVIHRIVHRPPTTAPSWWTSGVDSRDSGGVIERNASDTYRATTPQLVSEAPS
jgi:hypothetical protein